MISEVSSKHILLDETESIEEPAAPAPTPLIVDKKSSGLSKKSFNNFSFLWKKQSDQMLSPSLNNRPSTVLKSDELKKALTRILNDFDDSVRVRDLSPIRFESETDSRVSEDKNRANGAAHSARVQRDDHTTMTSKTKCSRCILF